MASLFEARDLEVYYGEVRALDHVSFTVDANEIVAMIGPNGAGKSTAVKAAAGLLGSFEGKITAGSVWCDGADVTNRPPDYLAAMGIAVVPEGRHIFHNMSVSDNLEMGAYLCHNAKEISDRLDRVVNLFAQLKPLLRRKAGALSGGEQQMVALGRALMLGPKLLIADEPSLGLSPNYVKRIFKNFFDVNKQGTAILLVEQNVNMALELAHRAYVFDLGRIVSVGPARELLRTFDFRMSYLGG